jgi:hypothetical protein
LAAGKQGHATTEFEVGWPVVLAHFDIGLMADASEQMVVDLVVQHQLEVGNAD